MHLLFVDDSRICAETLADIGVDLGHTVAVAHDGAECLALTASQRFDRIFLDISLPDANGKDLCDRIRQEGLSCGAIIVAVTGDAELVDKNELTCFTAWLLKPVALADIEAFLSPNLL